MRARGADTLGRARPSLLYSEHALAIFPPTTAITHVKCTLVRERISAARDLSFIQKMQVKGVDDLHTYTQDGICFAFVSLCRHLKKS